MLEHLVRYFDVEELVQAIARAGWQDYEPLIVLRSDNTVLEGNRRLAALRILANPSLGEHLHVPPPEDHEPENLPETVRVRWVDSREEARAWIGFKHINGPFKWDALAKARYAAEWCAEGVETERIARQLGDTHNTVVRLVNGWNVLQQSRALGFRIERTTKRFFALSHLYTALARPDVRRFLGLDRTQPQSQALGQVPVPASHKRQLLAFMTWLYGQGDKLCVVRSQNPDLNRLVKVLGHGAALTTLQQTDDLRRAYEEIEDRSVRFREALMKAIQQTENAARLVAHYAGDDELMRAGTNLRRTVVTLHESMRGIRDRVEFGEGLDGG